MSDATTAAPVAKEPKFTLPIMSEQEGQELLDLIDMAVRATGISRAGIAHKWVQRIIAEGAKVGIGTQVV